MDYRSLEKNMLYGVADLIGACPILQCAGSRVSYFEDRIGSIGVIRVVHANDITTTTYYYEQQLYLS